MRRTQVWSIALKDLADFRTSKYAMYSIIIPPLVLGSILPILYVAQFQAALSAAPYDVDTVGLPAPAGDPSGQVLTRVHIVGETVVDAKLNASLIENATLTRCFVENSVLRNVTLANSTVLHSNLEGDTRSADSVLVAVVYVDRPSPEEALLSLVLVNLLLLLLMIIPAMVPTVLASYSLVGEKASGSLEPLLATPTSDREILGGKIVAILLPTVAVGWAGGVMAVVVVGLTGGELTRRYPLPLDQFAAALLFFVPTFALLSILANVIVSSKVTDVRAAQQIGAIVVLPVVFLFILSLSGFQTLGFVGILVTSALVAAADLALAFACDRMFKREEILVRWK